jgi:hypothetical protein
MHSSFNSIHTFLNLVRALATVSITCFTLQTVTAETVIYEDGKTAGTLWANGTIALDDTFLTPDNKPTLKFTSSEDYGNAGINFYGANAPITVPANETTLQALIYSVDAEMNGLVVRMSTGDQSFDSEKGRWSLNGAEGKVNDFTPGSWHTLEFDLTSHPQFQPTISQIHNDGISFKVSESGTTIHIGALRLIEGKPAAYADIPEPRTFAGILGLAALGLASRRRLRK